jgi:hypothetical protein
METPNHQVSLAMASSSSPSPVVHGRARPFKKWWPWLIPAFVIANVVMFIITMYVNNCPKNYVSCIARFLGRFSFQPFKENPLLGPSTISYFPFFFFFFFFFFFAFDNTACSLYDSWTGKFKNR